MQAYRQMPKEEQTVDITKIGTETDKSPQIYPPETPKAEQHFAQFKKIYLTAYILSMEKNRLHSTIDKLLESLQRIESTQEQISQKIEQKSQQQKNKEQSAKRARRKADDIVRKWECREQYCGRKYGAHASLLQHVKLKHPEVYEQYC